MELPVADPGTERGEGPLIQCPYCDSEAMHKLAQILLPGLAAVCVDGTTGDLFRNPSVVAVDLRKEMVDYISQRSDTFIADTLIESEANQEGPEAEMPDDPFEIVSIFMDDFSSTKRNIIGHVSGWLLSDSRDDKIDDFVQEMEMTKFWPLERREAIAEVLLKNVDLKTKFHCPEKYENEERLADHKEQCSFRPVVCPNDFLEVEDKDFLVNGKSVLVPDSLKRRRVSYKMHDLIHDLARSILCDEIATIVPKDATISTKGYRYFSLIEPKKFVPKKVFQNARAIYVGGGNGMLFGNTRKNAKHLRSVIIENSVLSTPMLRAIFQVKNLKYLEMSELQCEALPEAITDVWSLQALYLESIDLLELPESIGKLKKLRTLNLSRCSKIKTLADSIGDCQMLSTLDLERCEEFVELPNSISRNKRLRVLRLVSTRISRLPSGITTLENLEYLKIKGSFELVGLPEGIGNLTKLKEFDIDDYGYQRMPPGIGQLTELEKLKMFCVETNEKYARISELATLSRISGKLSICFLRDLTDQSEARQACLKDKEKLHELELSWGSLHDTENAEHEPVALDGLEPPLGIKRIKIRMYAGGRFASWMLKQPSGGVQGHGQFPFLTKMSLDNLPNLKHLDGLVQ